MTTRDRLLALVVAVIWGINFPATHYALEVFPPFLFVALRFAVIAVPTLLFVPRPDVQWRWIIGYGLGFGVLEFGFLYIAMTHGMPSGLASLVLQSSAPFTVVLGGVLLREHVSGRQAAGVAVAMGGLTLIAVHQAQSAALLPVLLTVCGGFGWALGNIANRQARTTEPIRLTLWMSVVPPLPMIALSLATEGPHRDARAFTSLATAHAVPALLGLLYIVVVATLVGTVLWSALMSRNPSSQVAPFSMAVPPAGLLASWLMLGESVDLIEIIGAAVVVGGVVWAARTRRPTPQPDPSPPGDEALHERTTPDLPDTQPPAVVTATT